MCLCTPLFPRNLVKRGVLILLRDIQRYRNYWWRLLLLLLLLSRWKTHFIKSSKHTVQINYALLANLRLPLQTRRNTEKIQCSELFPRVFFSSSFLFFFLSFFTVVTSRNENYSRQLKSQNTNWM